MGFLDDMSILVGRGINAADRKTQSFKLQADLERIESDKQSALAHLGMVVYEHEAPGSYYDEQIREIADLEKRANMLRQQLNGLQTATNTGNGGPRSEPQYQSCPACGAPVTLDAPFCQSCGDNLEALKSQFRRCPVCNMYYPADYAFCERCGGQTVTLPIAPKATSVLAIDDTPSEPGTLAGEVSSCPHCGATLKPGSVFCGVCGHKL